ncbi:MFS transporter [Streptomyces sp. NPDC056361]|uniref:MFS transporter n=1 Tax=Streptomyces sp. NPDC056361 TaxID=3345795 RepID=UPI0035D75E22
MYRTGRAHRARPADGPHVRQSAGLGLRFRLLVCAYAVSACGNYLSLIALGLFSYAVTGTAFGVGAVMALRLLCGFVAGFVASKLLSRVAHRSVMIGADVARGVAMLVLALGEGRTSAWVLATAVAVLGAGNTFSTVALRSWVPALVGGAARARANGSLVMGRSLATVVGFASAAPVIAFGGFPLAFACNAAGFAISAITLLTLRQAPEAEGMREGAGEGVREGVGGAGNGPAPHTATATATATAKPASDTDHPATKAAGEVSGTSASTGTGTGTGTGTEAGDPVAVAPPESPARRSLFRWRQAGAPLSSLLIMMIALRGIDAFASSSHNVALPVVAHDAHPGESALFMTRFWATWAVGTFLAHLVLRRRKSEAAWGERAFALGTCAMALSFAAVFWGLPAAAVVAAAASAGFADGWTEIVYASRLQAAAEPLRSRLFGLSASAEQSGFALGTIATAAALETLPAAVVVTAFHSVAFCGALALLASLHVSTRRRRASRTGERRTHTLEAKRGTHDTTTGTSTLSRT